MRTTHLRFACVAAATVIAMAATAGAAEPVDWGSCHRPAFGENPQYAITTCSTFIDDPGLNSTDRERALLNRGRALQSAGKLSEANRDFVAAGKIAPEDPAPLVRQASIAFMQNKHRVALELATKAVGLDPRCAEAYFTLGAVAHSENDLTTAKRFYDKSTALDPDFILARFERLQIYIETGQHKAGLAEIQAIEALKTPELKTGFTDFHGKNAAFGTLARLEHAIMLESMGRMPEAKVVLDKLVADEPGAFSYGWRGWYYYRLNQFDLARADLDKAISYDPNYWILHNLRGQVDLYTHNYAAAVDEETRAIDLRPKHVGSSRWMRAIALRALNRTDEAEQDAFEAIWSDHAFARSQLVSLANQGYFDPPSRGSDPAPAIRTAVQACMLDEKCW